MTLNASAGSRQQPGACATTAALATRAAPPQGHVQVRQLPVLARRGPGGLFESAKRTWDCSGTSCARKRCAQVKKQAKLVFPGHETTVYGAMGLIAALKHVWHVCTQGFAAIMPQHVCTQGYMI